jgi:hypothetical protein
MASVPFQAPATLNGAGDGAGDGADGLVGDPHAPATNVTAATTSRHRAFM